MNIRKPAADGLDAAWTPPDCPCTAQQTERVLAMQDIRRLCEQAIAAAGSNKALIDFALDVINRTKGL